MLALRARTLSRRPKALADLSQAIRLAPKYAVAYRNRGNVHDKLGDTARARADFAQALSLEQNQVQAIPASYRK